MASKWTALHVIAATLHGTRAQPSYPECTGIMAVRSESGSVHGPWAGPTLIYQASNYTWPNGTVTPPPGGTEWYSGYGINNPTILITPNGTSLLAGRTCSGPEHPWVAEAKAWDGPYRSIDHNQQPFSQLNAEDPFMWVDTRGNYHMLHHWQSGSHNKYANGGHSFSRDGTGWTFSNATAYTKNISWAATGPNADAKTPWTVMGRRERPGLLLDPAWTTPLALFSSVQAHTWRTNVQPPWAEPQQSWLQSQPIRQHLADDELAGGGGACASDEDCNLNGQCTAAACVCDPQWQGPLCGSLALLPADPLGGHRREGFSGWGGNPFFDAGDQKYHVFTVEMTYGCTIDDFITNSQIVHATSDTATGTYTLAPIAAAADPGDTGADSVTPGSPAPPATVFIAPFAHAPHAWKDPTGGALVVVFEGRVKLPDSAQKRCRGDQPHAE